MCHFFGGNRNKDGSHCRYQKHHTLLRLNPTWRKSTNVAQDKTSKVCNLHIVIIDKQKQTNKQTKMTYSKFLYFIFVIFIL